jgi:hypothetical protein
MSNEGRSQLGTAQRGGGDHAVSIIRRKQRIPQSVEVTLAR